jgi:hypothetical protein
VTSADEQQSAVGVVHHGAHAGHLRHTSVHLAETTATADTRALAAGA